MGRIIKVLLRTHLSDQVMTAVCCAFFVVGTLSAAVYFLDNMAEQKFLHIRTCVTNIENRVTSVEKRAKRLSDGLETMRTCLLLAP
jgi:hypothetical protein